MCKYNRRLQQFEPGTNEIEVFELPDGVPFDVHFDLAGGIGRSLAQLSEHGMWLCHMVMLRGRHGSSGQQKHASAA